MGHKQRTRADGDHAVAADARHRSLADVATRQHGVVSSRQMEELGYGRSWIRQAAATGRLHRLHRGVYAVGHRSLGWRGRCLAAVLACQPAALASHRSAGWLWGFDANRPAAIEVTAPTRRHARHGLRLHYGRLTAEDHDVRDGIPVTAVPRTLLDLAATLSSDRLERAVERCEGLQLFDLTQVESLLRRVPGHQGAAELRRALALYSEEPAFTRSQLEDRFLHLVRKAGLPTPSMNYFDGGFELDAYWVDERLAVELDGYEFHRSRAAFERDHLRQEELALAGIESIRVTSRRIDDEPQELVERIARLLENRRQ